MSEWRYVVKEVPGNNAGKRRAVIGRVKSMVRAMHRSLELPMIRFNANLPGNTFFLGLAVNDPSCGDEAPPEYVDELFRRLGMPLSQVERTWWPQRGEQVEHFLRGFSECDHLTSPLTFEPLPTPRLAASLADAEEVEATHDSESYDHLLWWCSCKEFGTVAQVAALADGLGLTALEGSVWAVLKRMSLLGHLDVFQDQDRAWVWRIAPLTVVTNAPDGAAFLAGAQSGRLRKQLVDSLGAVLETTNGGPLRVSISTGNLNELESTISFAPRRIAGASARWAELLPKIQDWQANLVSDPAVASEPHQYGFERYVGGRFVAVNGQEMPSGFYRVQRVGQQFVPRYLLRTTDRCWLNGDFATLRFLSIAVGDQKPQARLCDDGTLVVPLVQRWPSLYERALVLASGQLPTTRSSGDRAGRLLAYRSIPDDAARKLASKLNVEFTS